MTIHVRTDENEEESKSRTKPASPDKKYSSAKENEKSQPPDENIEKGCDKISKDIVLASRNAVVEKAPC